MKDLTEAELIEMERRAVALVNELETVSLPIPLPVPLSTAWKDLLQQVFKDVETLCDHLRAKASR